MNDASFPNLAGRAAPNFVDDGLPPGSAAAAPQSGFAKHLIDALAIWATVYRNRFVMIGSLAVCVLLGVVITFLSTPIYRATARVRAEHPATVGRSAV